MHNSAKRGLEIACRRSVSVYTQLGLLADTTGQSKQVVGLRRAIVQTDENWTQKFENTFQ